MADSFAQFANKLQAFEKLATGRPVLEAIGRAAKDDIAEAVRGDLGDLSMSHWWRGSPIQITGSYDVKGDVVEVGPARRARGPMRVLEDGRARGSASDLVLVGRVRKDGTRRGRSRGRNQSGSTGKSTWSDAVALMEKRTPGRVEVETAKAITRIFNRG